MHGSRFARSACDTRYTVIASVASNTRAAQSFPCVAGATALASSGEVVMVHPCGEVMP